MSKSCAEYQTYKPDKILNYNGKVQRYMHLAKNIAFQSPLPDYRHGAVLVRGGSVINTGTNKLNFCSFGNRFRNKKEGKATVHAEIAAVLGIERSNTEGAIIYVARIGKAGAYRLSKPCSMCQAVMKHVGIKRVVYTIDNKTVGSYKI